MGGAYWIFGFVLSITSLPYALTYYENNGGKAAVAEIAWNVTYVIVPCAVTLIFVFFMTMNKEYRKTFYSTERGKDLSMSRFLNNSDDASKADAIFLNTRRFWTEIESEVEIWVRQNWKKWMDDEPEWFDENMRAMIPDSFIPASTDEDIEKIQSQRRRSSVIGNTIGGAIKTRRGSRRASNAFGAESSRVAPQVGQAELELSNETEISFSP